MPADKVDLYNGNKVVVGWSITGEMWPNVASNCTLGRGQSPLCRIAFVATVEQIFSVVHDVLRVELVVKIAGAEKCVNQQLIDLGFADDAEESRLSHVS